MTAYVVGATANQNLFLAIHEISHNLAFKKGWMNRVLAVVANLGIGVPYSASFRVCCLVFPFTRDEVGGGFGVVQLEKRERERVSFRVQLTRTK